MSRPTLLNPLSPPIGAVEEISTICAKLPLGHRLLNVIADIPVENHRALLADFLVPLCKQVQVGERTSVDAVLSYERGAINFLKQLGTIDLLRTSDWDFIELMAEALQGTCGVEAAEPATKYNQYCASAQRFLQHVFGPKAGSQLGHFRRRKARKPAHWPQAMRYESVIKLMASNAPMLVRLQICFEAFSTLGAKELQMLRWSDVDIYGDVAVLRIQGNTQAFAVLFDGVGFFRYCRSKLMMDATSLIWEAPRKAGKPRDVQWAKHEYPKLATALKIPRFTRKNLQYALKFRLLSNGFSDMLLQHLFGQKEIQPLLQLARELTHEQQMDAIGVRNHLHGEETRQGHHHCPSCFHPYSLFSLPTKYCPTCGAALQAVSSSAANETKVAFKRLLKEVVNEFEFEDHQVPHEA